MIRHNIHHEEKQVQFLFVKFNTPKKIKKSYNLPDDCYLRGMNLNLYFSKTSRLWNPKTLIVSLDRFVYLELVAFLEMNAFLDVPLQKLWYPSSGPWSFDNCEKKHRLLHGGNLYVSR